MQTSSISMSTDMSLDDYSFVSPRTPSSEDIMAVAPWQEFENQLPQKRSFTSRVLNLQSGSSSLNDLSRTRNSEDSMDSHRRLNILKQLKNRVSRPNLKKPSQDQTPSQQPPFPQSDIDLSSTLYPQPTTILRVPSPIHRKKSGGRLGKQKSPIPIAPPLPPRSKDYEQPPFEFSMDKIRDVSLHEIVKDFAPGDRRHELSNSESTSSPSFEEEPPLSFIDPFRKASQQTLYDRVPGPGLAPFLSEPLRKLGSSGNNTADDGASWTAPQSWAVGAVDMDPSLDDQSTDEEVDNDVSEDSNEPPSVISQGLSSSYTASTLRDPPFLVDKRKPSSNLANEVYPFRKGSRDRSDRPQGTPVRLL